MMRMVSIALLMWLSACSASQDVHETRFIMGTLVTFTVAASDRNQANDAIAAAAAEMQRIEDEFTIYGDHDNAIKAFNAAPPGTAVTLPDEASALLTQALKVKQQSAGAFDPVLGKLNLLWGFSIDPPPTLPPPDLAITKAVPPKQCIEKRGKRWLRRDARCLLDFGAIAKGYAIDRGIAVFRAHGIHNAIINAGGDIRLIGNHGDRPWHIGIRHPRNSNGVIASMQLHGDVSIVTSGDYERFFIYDDRRYHHLIDPETGWPGTQSQSATVIAASATMADAWSTALFIMGEPGIATLRQQHIQAMLVDAQGQMHGHLDEPLKDDQ